MSNLRVVKFDSYANIFEYVSPSCQRDINENSVLEMREHIQNRLEKKLEPLFGVIDVAIFNNVYYVIDGQHRLKALRDEYIENNFQIPFFVIFYDVNTWEELEEIFVTRNKNVPIPNYILDRGDLKRELLRAIENILKSDNYGVIFNSKVVRPHINLTNFMNSLKDSELIESIDSVDKFLQVLNKENQILRNNCNSRDWLKHNTVTENMLVKCRSTEIYVGLSKIQLWIHKKYNEPNVIRRVINRLKI